MKVEAHEKITRNKSIRTYYGIDNVPTHEVGGCVDTLNRTLLDAW